MEIIDTHCHVYPALSYFLKENIAHIPSPLLGLIPKIEKLESDHRMKKELLYSMAKPLLNFIHKAQSNFNDNSGDYLFAKDQLFRVGSLTTILSSTINDLKTEMMLSNISKSIVIAHPPLITNDFILELAKRDKRFIPVVNIPRSIADAPNLLRNYIVRGAKALKIHATADGIDTMDKHYLSLLEIAAEFSLPVIIHTGALEIAPFYQEPDLGHAEHFESWFHNYNTNFVLAHMNIHFPQVAVDFCKKYKNVYTDTSWQSEENILSAINQIGAEKIMFGTDWPIIGNNIEVSIGRLNSLSEKELISKEQFEMVASTNAKKLFNLD